MGMYTGLRVSGVIKKEYIKTIKDIVYGDGDWRDYFSGSFVNEWRAGFIPSGVLSYMPNEWDEDTSFNNDFNENTRRWVFQCSLKNYNQEIEQFMDQIVPVVFEEVDHFEYHYEEWEAGLLYELRDGKLVHKGEKIVYYD